MKLIFSTTILFFLFHHGIQAQKDAPPQRFINGDVKAAGFDPERLKNLDNWLSEIVAKGIAPNAVTFVARKGVIVHSKAYGYSNMQKKDGTRTDDIFRIASQTKAIASVTLMTYFEEGKFLLDDAVSKYIPAFADVSVLVSYDTANPVTGKFTTRKPKTDITIRHLLSHAAGIPYEHPLEERDEFKVPYLSSMKAEKLEDVVNRLAKRPLITDPGTSFVYGLNTDVVGRLIEVISGKPLDVAIAERVLKPLGMNDTYFYLPKNKKSRLVELYSKAGANDKLTLHPFDTTRLYPVAGAQVYFSAGAGLVSTAADYAKFCQMLLNGGGFNDRKIVSRKTVDLMLQNQIGENRFWDRNDYFGLGFQVITPESKYGDQASVGSFTWGGAYCSEYTIDPKEDMILLIFTNVHPYAHYSDFVRKFRILVYQALQ
jgi:CubicO group peptidase (beta-lactamase class C family)